MHGAHATPPAARRTTPSDPDVGGASGFVGLVVVRTPAMKAIFQRPAPSGRAAAEPSDAAPGCPAQLVAEVVPGIVGSDSEAVPAPSDRGPHLLPALGSEQQGRAGTDRGPYGYAGGEESEGTPIAALLEGCAASGRGTRGHVAIARPMRASKGGNATRTRRRTCCLATVRHGATPGRW